MKIEVKSWEAVLIFLIIAIIAVFSLPFFPSSENISTILTISTFLFGIFAGFIIASRMSRFTRFRELLTNETGFLISLYEYSKFAGEKVSQRISKLIDDYIVDGFLYEVYGFHQKTESSFYAIFDELKNFKTTNDEQKEGLNQMRWIIRDMPKDREEMYLLEEDKISITLKSTLVLLTAVILFCLFYLRTNVWYSDLITILLSTSVVLVLFLIRDLDELNISDYAIEYGIYFRLFNIIGKPRFYTSDAIQHRKLKLPKSGTYRYGVIQRIKGVPSYKEIKTIVRK